MLNYIKKLLGEIASLVSGAWSFLTTAWNLIVNFEATAETFISNGLALVANATTEFQKIKDFTFDPKWNTRVISVPRAIPAIQDFVATVPLDILDKSKDLIELFKNKVQAEPEIKAEDLKFLPEKFATFLEKILGWVALIVDMFVTVNQAITDLNSIVDDIRQIREQLEGLDALFLPQGTPKRSVTLTYRKRGAS